MLDGLKPWRGSLNADQEELAAQIYRIIGQALHMNLLDWIKYFEHEKDPDACLKTWHMVGALYRVAEKNAEIKEGEELPKHRKTMLLKKVAAPFFTENDFGVA